MAAAELAEHERQGIDEGAFGRSVAFWIGAALPVAFVVITLAVWLMLDVSLGKAFAISAWPSILTGAFGGGFVGVVRAGSE